MKIIRLDAAALMNHEIMPLYKSVIHHSSLLVATNTQANTHST